jgi:hypothetical protein
MRILGHRFGQKLQRHKPMQPRVFRLVHHAHTTAADFL